MQIILKKQPPKYLTAVDVLAKNKLYKALDQVAQLEGDIIIVSTINTRSNIKY